jgi:hypothetical protein
LQPRGAGETASDHAGATGAERLRDIGRGEIELQRDCASGG